MGGSWRSTPEVILWDLYAFELMCKPPLCTQMDTGMTIHMKKAVSKWRLSGNLKTGENQMQNIIMTIYLERKMGKSQGHREQPESDKTTAKKILREQLADDPIHFKITETWSPKRTTQGWCFYPRKCSSSYLSLRIYTFLHTVVVKQASLLTLYGLILVEPGVVVTHSFHSTGR